MKPEDSRHGRLHQPDAAAELKEPLSSEDFHEPRSEQDALAQVFRLERSEPFAEMKERNPKRAGRL